MRKKILMITAVFLIAFGQALPALANTLLYIPADDRPVSFQNVVDTAKAAGMTVLTPPQELIAGRAHSGNSDSLWQWLFDNIKQADAVVVSSDTLIYGGLVDSRIHHLTEDVLVKRLYNFDKLKTLNSTVRVYVFGTIMRTPQASAGGVEPPYYEVYGPHIFRLTALSDKQELIGLSDKEKKQLEEAEDSVPGSFLKDWFERRSKNLNVNTAMIEKVKQGVFSYFLLGRDDTSPYSQSHREARNIAKVANDLPASKFATFPGADQLGMVLVARVSNDMKVNIPVVEVRYTQGAGPATVPSYEDQPVGGTITAHIYAAGGIAMAKPVNADIVLFVNTPVNGKTLEAEAIDNIPGVTPAVEKLSREAVKAVNDGKTVAVADIAYGNGADNSLLQAMIDDRLLDKLGAYSGWNTASNTIGYAVGQGMMSEYMTRTARLRLLTVRYLDDWAYQANIRKQLCYEMLYPQNGSPVHLDDFKPQLTAEVEKRLREYTKKYLWFVKPEQIHATFPWNRMFEVEVKVD